MAFLELEDVVKRFGRNVVVDGFNLDVKEGEFVSFLGGSGCGKTTTLRMVAGFETPTSGSIRISGTDVVQVAPNRRGVGMVFQNYALFPNMTVRKNIEFGLKVAKWKKADIRRRIDEMLALIHMEELGDRYPHQMSGGQQQRASLARALAVNPRVLLLDEPLSALDAKIRAMLRTEIRAIQQKTGITTIYVTHDQEEALSLSDRIVVMNAGRIEQVGTPFEIYNKPATPFVASFIGNLNILEADVLDSALGLLSVEGQQVLAAGPVADSVPRTKLSLRPEMLSLNEGIPGANALNGTLANVVFLGSIVRLTIRIGTREISVDRFNAPHLALPEVGSDVTISFPREACLVSEITVGGGSPMAVLGTTL
jgi:putative spermidine/putrescine transport system ATP-binding protein